MPACFPRGSALVVKSQRSVVCNILLTKSHISGGGNRCKVTSQETKAHCLTVQTPMISLSNSVPQYILPAAGLALPLVSAPLFTQAVRISTVGGWVRGGGSSVWLLATFRSVNFSDICRLLSPLIGEGNSYTVSAMVWLPLPPTPHPTPSHHPRVYY